MHSETTRSPAAPERAPAPPARPAKDTVPAPERRRARAGGARHVRHLETTATRGVAPARLRPGLQAQSPLAARRRGPPPPARPAPAGCGGRGGGVAVHPRPGVERPQGPRKGAPRETTATRPARARHLRAAELSGAEHYNSRHAVNPTAPAVRRHPARPPAWRSRRLHGAALAARGAGTRAMGDAQPPLQGSSKPHLEKLTLGISHILGGSWKRGLGALTPDGGHLEYGVDMWKCAHLSLDAEAVKSSPGVTEVTIIEKAPAERHMISSWEQVSITLSDPTSPQKEMQFKCP
ncbi:hypothetical protein J0S82_001727 [Galemys pyrenaicus]|uniref:Uncharacterized protein n=1 Tax=Galemys pyrenaicus TaxID=202257 RepID=A0A8J6DV05_GALPY|nr:hypothetical protein J0S82_001727 [Galemys pyrenaicus]